MGMFDRVWVQCPNCSTENEFQSKGGGCFLGDYNLEDCPEDVLSDVNRHAPIRCEYCSIHYSVDIEQRKSVKID
jgi:DNA-directed RNA polymerase subunit RPC12/RpoP